ncbi:MAG: carboxy-S-adenosyl-L-methionine synthase CmoA [Gammaproteobacteria bacterium]|nr:carboxy-S-adenosyl-L-methionine synthase CmoA [Gammaproteobacteria bacterium]
MTTPPNKDQIYASPHDMLVDFNFNEHVADVFPDMIRRSVPGYENLITLLGLLAKQYVMAGSQVYDLGCSLGAATLSMRHRITPADCRIIAVDNSPAMVERARKIIERDTSSIPVDILCADIQDIDIHNASMVVLNFTLQFLPPDQRLQQLQKIYHGLQPGGVLVLSEKLNFSDNKEQIFQNKLHLAFKKANGYSDMEISQKRTALEKVLIPDTFQQHQQRLREAGFIQSYPWFQCFNFCSLIAIK